MADISNLLNESVEELIMSRVFGSVKYEFPETLSGIKSYSDIFLFKGFFEKTRDYSISDLIALEVLTSTTIIHLENV